MKPSGEDQEGWGYAEELVKAQEMDLGDIMQFGTGIENSPAQQDLRPLMGEKLDMSQRRSLTAQNASRLHGCIQSPVGSGVRKRILPL